MPPRHESQGPFLTKTQKTSQTGSGPPVHVVGTAKYGGSAGAPAQSKAQKRQGAQQRPTRSGHRHRRDGVTCQGVLDRDVASSDGIAAITDIPPIAVVILAESVPTDRTIRREPWRKTPQIVQRVSVDRLNSRRRPETQRIRTKTQTGQNTRTLAER